MAKVHRIYIALLVGCAICFGAVTAQAEITIGVSLTVTGPGAALGIPLKNTIALLPNNVDGEPVRFIILDDGNFPAVAAKDAKRLVESRVDIIWGGCTVPSGLAVSTVAAENKTPNIPLAPFPPKPDTFPWVFPIPQPVAVMAAPLFEHMKETGITTLGFIGFSDGYGEAWLRQTQRLAEANGIKVVIVERYDRTDRSVLQQTRRILAANPAAVLVAASGSSPGVLPMRMLRERGYAGKFYETHGVASNAFLREAGAAGEGVVLPAGPVLVPEQLPASHPSREVGLQYQKLYEAKYGADNRNMFGAHIWDAWLLFEHAAKVALKKAKPGTPEFRQILRDELEATREFPISHGVVTMTDKDHTGLDARSRVLVTIEKGHWVLHKVN